MRERERERVRERERERERSLILTNGYYCQFIVSNLLATFGICYTRRQCIMHHNYLFQFHRLRYVSYGCPRSSPFAKFSRKVLTGLLISIVGNTSEVF